MTALHPGLVCHAIHAILKFHVLSGSILSSFVSSYRAASFAIYSLTSILAAQEIVNTTAQLYIVVREDLQLENLKSETVVSLKYEGVPSRAGKPSG